MKARIITFFMGILVLFASTIAFISGMFLIDKAWNMNFVHIAFGEPVLDVDYLGNPYTAGSIYNRGYLLAYLGFVGTFFGLYITIVEYLFSVQKKEEKKHV